MPVLLPLLLLLAAASPALAHHDSAANRTGSTPVQAPCHQ